MSEAKEQSASIDAGRAKEQVQPRGLQEEKHDDNRWKKIEIGCAVVGAIAALGALLIAGNANQKSNEGIRLAEAANLQAEFAAQRAELYASLATRIEACMAIATHHNGEMERSGPADGQVGIPMVSYDGEVLRIASNSERAEAAVNMGRELSICASKSPDFEAVKSCVADATNNQIGKQVLDETAPGEGRMNPAC